MNLAKSMNYCSSCSEMLLLWRSHHQLWRRWWPDLAVLWSAVPMIFVPPRPLPLLWTLWRNHLDSYWNICLWKFRPGVLNLNFFNYCNQQWWNLPTASIDGSSHRHHMEWLAQGLLSLFHGHEQVSLTLIGYIASSPPTGSQPMDLVHTNKGTLPSYSTHLSPPCKLSQPQPFTSFFFIFFLQNHRSSLFDFCQNILADSW